MGIARDVSSAMLQEKIKEMSAEPEYESSYKKDIVSLLLRAREAARDPLRKEGDSNSELYMLSDEEMVDQAVSPCLGLEGFSINSPLRIAAFPRCWA